MRSRLALGLLAVALVAIGYVVSSDERAGAKEAVGAVPPDAQGESAGRFGPTAYSSAREVERSTPLERVAANAEASREAVFSKYARELAKAYWVEGRVLFPNGTPLDEECQVVAVGRRFAHGPLHRAEVGADGRFRVAFSKRSRTGRVRLEAKYLIAEESERFAVRDASERVLEPKLGGCIVGRMVPTGEFADAPVHGDVVVAGRSSIRTTVDCDATFELTGMPPGRSYEVRFKSPDWMTVRSSAVEVRAGETSEVELLLDRGRFASGIVVDGSGQTIDGATVLVLDSGGLHQVTEADGRFLLPGLNAGKLVLGVDRVGYVPLRLEFDSAGRDTSAPDLRLVLDRGTTIRGRVVWDDGSPVAGAEIEHVLSDTATSWTEGMPLPGETSEDGTFVLSGLGDAPVRIDARAKKKIKVEVTSRVTGKPMRMTERVPQFGWAIAQPGTTDLVIRLGAGATLSGIVVDEGGRPVLDYGLRVEEVETDAVGSRFERTFSRRMRTNDGTFRVPGLRAGTFVVKASAAGFEDPSPQTRTLPQKSEPLRIVLPRFGSIGGVVLSPSGAPVPGALVATRRNEVLSSADGTFLFDETESGPYWLSATAAGYAPIEEVTIRVAPGEDVLGVELRLRAAAVLTGVVLDRDGKPAADREVACSSPGHESYATTDAAGRFRFDDLIPGLGEVTVYGDVDDAPTVSNGVEDWSIVDVFDRSKVVELRADREQHVVIPFPDLAVVTVRGRVVANGEPWSFDRVRVGSASEPGFTTASDVDEDGAFVFGVPRPGDYDLTLWMPSSGLLVELRTTIPSATSYELDFDLQFRSVDGRVVDSAGAPLGGETVRLRPVTTLLGARRCEWFGTTEADGRFRAELLPGTYDLTVEGTDGDDVVRRVLVGAATDPQHVEVVFEGGSTGE